MDTVTIHKFTLQPVDEQFVNIPGFIKILSVAEQRGQIVLYAIVDPYPDPEAEPIAVAVRVHGTGHEIPARVTNWHFLGTVKLLEGVLMFHIFVDRLSREA